jgi:hypothetical protein
MDFLGAGLHQPPSRALSVAALGDARRMFASHARDELLISEWLTGEIRLHGIRENAATLAVMEVPEYRHQAAQTYALHHPDRLKALNDLACRPHLAAHYQVRIRFCRRPGGGGATPAFPRRLLMPRVGHCMRVVTGSVFMSQENRVWQLVRGNELLAGLVVTGGDFPWLNAQVRPAAGFAEVQPLFEDELRQLDHLDEDPAPWQAAYDRIRQAVRLVAMER